MTAQSDQEMAEFFASRGFGIRIGFGERPALAVIDLMNAFTDPSMPLGANLDREIEAARELLAAARDYHQAKMAQEQNEVVKKLTVIASLLLVPTFIVGVYGQNFDHMPELHWRLGYLWSWGWIVASVLALLAFFRWRKWI